MQCGVTRKEGKMKETYCREHLSHPPMFSFRDKTVEYLRLCSLSRKHGTLRNAHLKIISIDFTMLIVILYTN